MMESKPPRRKTSKLVSIAILGCALSLHAQTAPIITTQPASQTNLAGTTVTFNVSVSGSGPFTYQWQFNGTNLPNNIITTVAGDGNTSYSGDGGAATNANLDGPAGVAFDASGNLYIADEYHDRVRMVNTNGIIITVAGKSSGGFSGDGGAATNSTLNEPFGLSLDASGNLYIADTMNQRIRRVDTNGIITTVAGKSPGGYSGDGGMATNANLASPHGVTLDASGKLYIVDDINNRIRMVNTNGIITTVAGNGGPGYFGDGGPATNASLRYPDALASDAIGNLYIADNANFCIRMVATNGIITTVAGPGQSAIGDGGAATNASLRDPDGVALDTFGNLYISDVDNNRIRMVNTNGIIITVAGNGIAGFSGDGGSATNASLGGPSGLALDASGDLFIADGNRIREVHFAGFNFLSFVNLSMTNAGNYSVVISSPYGSVTSSIVSLTVVLPPQIISSGTSFGFQNNQFGFNLTGTTGQTVVVEGSTDLLDWVPLLTNTLSGGPIYFFDPGATNFPWRFYRAISP